MIPQLVRRNFSYGSGALSPDGTKFLLSIPKNASSYLANWATLNSWTLENIDNSDRWSNIEEIVIVLRDPVSRWVSGISQYIATYILSVYGPNGPIFDAKDITEHDFVITPSLFKAQYNPLVERLIFDVIDRFDDHVWPQHELFENLRPAVSRKFFYLDSLLDQNITNYLGFAPAADLDRNEGAGDTRIQELQEFFRERLEFRPELRERLVKNYRVDYEIIREQFNL